MSKIIGFFSKKESDYDSNLIYKENSEKIKEFIETKKLNGELNIRKWSAVEEEILVSCLSHNFSVNQILRLFYYRPQVSVVNKIEKVNQNFRFYYDKYVLHK